MPINSFLYPGAKVTPAYEVANSCRFNRADGPNMTKTPSSSGNLRKWTWSFWVKRGSISNGSQTIFNAGSSSNTQIRFDSDDTINFYQYSSGYTARLATTQVFRDVSAWYHIVAHWDTANGTAGDRMKLYVNGAEVTSFSADVNPSQNLDSYFGASGTALYVGDKGDGAEEMDGYLAEVVFIDGQNLAPTSFGEFDEDSPTIWKPIDVSGLTFGTNGFYLDFEDSSNLGNDKNGGTDLTENNIAAIDQSTDTCTNNYATMNPLAKSSTGTSTFAQGNLKISTNESQLFGAMSTIGVTQGKWYVECKKISQDSGSSDTLSRLSFGVTNKINHSTNNPTADAGNYYLYGIQTVYNGSTDLGNLAGTSHIADGKIQMIALDLDNNRVTFGADGQWMDGSGSYNQSSPSSYVSITDPADTEAGYFFFQGDGSSKRGYTGEWNFGGTQTYTISSGNSDANGYGNFEYAVPSGYYALNTKNLAEFG